MSANLKNVARLIGGIALTLLGISGLILPVLPGWLFLIPGLMILADYFPPIHRLLQWAKRKAAAYGIGGGTKASHRTPTLISA